MTEVLAATPPTVEDDFFQPPEELPAAQMDLAAEPGWQEVPPALPQEQNGPLVPEQEAMDAYRAYSQRAKDAGGPAPLEFSDWKQRLYVPQEVQPLATTSSESIRAAVAATLEKPTSPQLTAEVPPDEAFIKKYTGRPVTAYVHGQAETDWQVVQLNTLSGGQEVVLAKADGTGLRAPREVFEIWNQEPVAPGPSQEQSEPLSPRRQAIQARRDQWTAENPGKSYLTPEGPTIGPEDIKRLEAEAENYGFGSFDRKNIAESYLAIETEAANREAALRQKLQAPGENYSPDVIERLTGKAREDAMLTTRGKLIETAVPIPLSVSKKEAKKLSAKRQQLLSILSKSPEDFAAMQADWEAYEDIAHTNAVGSLQEQALKGDKKLNAVAQRDRIKGEIFGLDEKYGGSLKYISELGLEADTSAAEVLKQYQERLGRHKTDEEYLEADQDEAFKGLKSRLEEMLAGSRDAAGNPLAAEAVQQKLQEAEPQLQTWLEAMITAEGDPLADLTEYKNKQRAYELWDSRRRQAVEYLGPMVLLRSVQNRLRPQPEQTAASPAEAGKALKTLLDPRGIGERNGGHALRRAEQLSDSDVNIYQAGIMGQLEQARTYSRHQGDIMKAALMINALAVGGAQEMAGAWSSLSESERTKEFKKKMFGKAAVGSLLAKRLAAKAAQKAKDSAKAAAQAAAMAPNTTGFFGGPRKDS